MINNEAFGQQNKKAIIVRIDVRKMLAMESIQAGDSYVCSLFFELLHNKLFRLNLVYKANH